MALKIKHIEENSLAQNSKLKANDIIVSINGNKIMNFLDLQYYASESQLDILYYRDGKDENVSLMREYRVPLGIQPYQHKCRTCANNCIFCFVDQIKPGLRNSLTVKDDDYCYSFVYGNFITLTNLTDFDFERIIEQKLSPLYISVHVTDRKKHKETLRYKHDFDLLARLNQLSQNGIEFHTQLVLVPGWNDNLYLEKSILDLCAPALNTLSIAIVPVGVTKFRKSLFPVSSFDKASALQVINTVETLQQKHKTNSVWCSDEFYVLANHRIPSSEFYQNYSQIENGIGMIRKMLDNWNENRNQFISEIKNLDESIVILCGISIQHIITSIANDINDEFAKKKVEVLPIVNQFFGESVTVTGLLTAQDIQNQYIANENSIPMICSSIFNHENISLDQVSKDSFPDFLDSQVLFVNEFFDHWELLD